MADETNVPESTSDKEQKAAEKAAKKAAKQAQKQAEKARKERIKASKPKKEGNIFTRMWAAIKKFCRDFKGTCKKVIWPDRRTVLKNSGVVFLCILIVGACIWILDLAFTRPIRYVQELIEEAQSEADEEEDEDEDEDDEDETDEDTSEEESTE